MFRASYILSSPTGISKNNHVPLARGMEMSSTWVNDDQLLSNVVTSMNDLCEMIMRRDDKGLQKERTFLTRISTWHRQNISYYTLCISYCISILRTQECIFEFIGQLEFLEHNLRSAEIDITSVLFTLTPPPPHCYKMYFVMFQYRYRSFLLLESRVQ